MLSFVDTHSHPNDVRLPRGAPLTHPPLPVPAPGPHDGANVIPQAPRPASTPTEASWADENSGRLELFNRLPDEVLQQVLAQVRTAGGRAHPSSSIPFCVPCSSFRPSSLVRATNPPCFLSPSAAPPPPPSLATLSLVSRRFHALVRPSLYAHLDVATPRSLVRLAETLRVKPSLARHARSLCVYTSRVDWRCAESLARTLEQQSADVEVLRVRFAASDLPMALDFFAHLSPREFEWYTQPCWLVRPGELFTRFLMRWPRLEHLSLGNFAFDAVFADCVTQLHSLHTLHLRGASNKNLCADVVRTLLGSRTLGSPLSELRVADCPQRRRALIEAELAKPPPLAPTTSVHGRGEGGVGGGGASAMPLPPRPLSGSAPTEPPPPWSRRGERSGGHLEQHATDASSSAASLAVSATHTDDHAPSDVPLGIAGDGGHTPTSHAHLRVTPDVRRSGMLRWID